jgi:hypothetical protein
MSTHNSTKKIHAAISRIPEQELNPSDNQELHRTVSQVYSDYIHAASTQAMDMYGGNPSRFNVSGMLDTPRIPEFTENAWDYFYRRLMAIMMVALTFKHLSMVYRTEPFSAINFEPLFQRKITCSVLISVDSFLLRA